MPEASGPEIGAILLIILLLLIILIGVADLPLPVRLQVVPHVSRPGP